MKIFGLFLIVLFFSCSTPSVSLFKSKSFHEQYGNKLSDAGLKETALGRAWFSAAAEALQSPAAVNLPYKEIGYFAADKPRAVGLKFSAKRGEKLHFQILKNPSLGFSIYTDLWLLHDRNEPSLITSVDTAKTAFEYEVDRDGSFLLRLQPELLKSGDYTLSISIGPTLGFPVSNKNAKIGSFWGAARDGGVRKHEGIDIFATRGTPLVAAADGIISSVSENNLGGKVIFMRPSGKDYSLYYAHLDQQLTSSGNRVKAGDTIGTVGNTGNAASTSPHLHFGIYTMNGAIDPFPFVNPGMKKPENVSADPNILRKEFRLNKDLNLPNMTYNSRTVIKPLAISAKHFRVVLPDGFITTLPSALVSSVTPISQLKLKNGGYLKDNPVPNAPNVTKLNPSASLKVLGYYKDYTYVEADSGILGWVESSLLR